MSHPIRPIRLKARAKSVPSTAVAITTPFIKLDSFLKLAGLAMTGGEAKALVLEGLVAVDGEVCLERGRKIRPGQRVVVDRRVELVVVGESPPGEP